MFTFTFAHFTLDVYDNEDCKGNTTKKFTDLELDECKDVTSVIESDTSIKLTKDGDYTGKTFEYFNILD